MIAAVTKAAMLDMDIAVSVYGETLIQQISDREERVHAAIGEFDASINCMLGKFAKMTWRPRRQLGRARNAGRPL